MRKWPASKRLCLIKESVNFLPRRLQDADEEGEMKNLFSITNRILGLFAGLAFVSLLSAIESGKSQTLSSPEQVQEGLSAADWQGIRSAAAAGVIGQEAYVKASNTGENDFFGRSVAVSGDTVVVASLEDSSTTGVNSVPNESAIDSGAAYVFVRSNGVWSQQAYLKASNPGGSDSFGESVAISGDIIVVGAPYESSNAVGVNASGQGNNSASGSGAAYVFVRSGSSWSQEAYLKASNTGGGDNFGVSVGVSGDTVFVGARGEDSDAVGVNFNQINNNASNSGAAYVFVRSGSNWSQQAYLKASNTGASDNFGISVAISGNTVVVGAENEDSSTSGVNGVSNEAASQSGAAYIFVRSSGAWSQQAFLKSSNPGLGDFFGCAVAVSGDTVAIGAYGEASSIFGINGIPNEAASRSGAAFVFVRSGATWSQQAFLKASNTGASDQFGRSVAVSGDTVVVGASFEDSSTAGVNPVSNEAAFDSGAAYIFARSSGVWSQQAYLKASNAEGGDNFGISTAISGSTLIVGGYLEDSITTGVNTVPNDAGTATWSGASYIFTLPVDPPVYTVKAKVRKAKFGKVTGAGKFEVGSKVILKAKAKKGYDFVGWYENKKRISKKEKLVIKNLTKNRSLVAKFK
jgi:uncharacterized repeat protein (TIGR02543 family)